VYVILIKSLQELRSLKLGEIQENKIYCLNFQIKDKKRIILFGTRLKQLKRETSKEEVK